MPIPEDSTARARGRFADWLLAHPDGDEAALRELCSEHEQDAERFRRWRQQLVEIGELAAPAVATKRAAEPVGSAAPAGSGAGQQVGPYRLIEELGRGAQAVVHLAEDTRSDDLVALKLLPPYGAQAHDRLERFRREAELLARVDHPGLCAVRDAGECDDTVYLAMRYVPGRTLAAWIEEARTAAGQGGERTIRLPGQQGDEPAWLVVVRFFENAARALHASHERGLIHRDIKPSNLMVGEDGRPVLLDFGLARETDDLAGLTMSGDLIGTPAYMSPEQLAAQRIRLDRRTDVYSLGATLYETLTLARPFEAPTMDRLFSAILSVDPPSVQKAVPDLPPDLGVVVATCLEKDRSRRYQTALDLAEDLRRVGRRDRVRARRLGSFARMLRWARRHPLAAAFWISQLVALAVVIWLNTRLRAEHSRFQSVAVVMTLRRAVEAERDLYPPRQEMAPAMRRWLSEYAEPLVARRGELATVLAQLQGEQGELSGGPPTVETDTEQFVIETLATTIDDLDRFFADPARGPDGVRERIAWAEQLQQRSIDRHLQAWRACQRAIRIDPRYQRLELPDQPGLVPIGVNPKGLWEFAHLRSAADPDVLPPRDPDTGFVTVGEPTGIVFVLIPPGLWRDQRVDAFFLAAHELTKAQWHRLTRQDDVGYFRIGTVYDGTRIDGSFPVERQSWVRCEQVLREQGLRLPSVAEWERGARAGTSTAWHCGDDPAELARFANLKDTDERQVLDLVRLGQLALSLASLNPTSDGYKVIAPVGSFAPNDWGLFDVHGNVFEWCQDQIERFSDDRSIRGGSWREVAAAAKCSLLAFDDKEHESDELGVRVARPILLPRPQ